MYKNEKISNLQSLIREQESLIADTENTVIYPARASILNAEKELLRISFLILKKQSPEEYSNLDPNNMIHGWWDCEESPTNKCIYNIENDPVRDSCLFCGEPDERK